MNKFKIQFYAYQIFYKTEGGHGFKFYTFIYMMYYLIFKKCCFDLYVFFGGKT